MSRFVSAGAINAETGEAVVADDKLTTTTTTSTTVGGAGSEAGAGARTTVEAKKSAEWEIVQRELEAERKRREEARIKSVEGGEKSLYDVLQANKAAKQAAFEEANKIRNQFRALDDDEIDFLDEVRASKRAAEEKVRRETEEGLAAFRRARGQEQGVKRAGEGDDDAVSGGGDVAAGVADSTLPDGADGGDEEWAVGPRKRRRKEKGFGVKRERGDDGKVEEEKKKKKAGGEGDGEVKGALKGVGKGGLPVPAATSIPVPAAPVKGKPSLVAYGSDSDDE
ncbi:hypothetical protein CORC01_09838 [Colletotrichum orchidophilum]|uniref:FAM192A/Fyv6 N-terminal domain-containing protein n=1 Tax=Colletotrichum orchidophilum TaxID=1209926 RepID=A0A1G4B0H0_9PEZI|nr:uncharacterized protein CORC01_09838 [Colletotrichum orchidophilum]OHE94919.1 hypothetical protein CORC01_09838 [Colletotrichum orchidophilum]